MKQLIFFPGMLVFACLCKTAALNAQILVADQTFKMDGRHEFTYALAQGDTAILTVQDLAGRQIKSVEFLQFPDNMIFRAYELDSLLDKRIVIPHTGVYQLRFSESGMSKKVCRFTLHRAPASAETGRFDTRVSWDVRQYPQYQVLHRSVIVGTRTDVVSLGGQATVPGSKFGIKKSVSNYQFTLPPHTVRWAYRLSVGQAAAEARRKDQEKFSQLLKQGAVKMASYQPETALAAFALGMAIDLTMSTTGENVEYVLLDGDNLNKFLKGEPYQAYIQQPSVAVDVQRRYSPLEGTWFFGLRNDNWVDDIVVSIDIEAVTETPVYQTESYLEALRP